MPPAVNHSIERGFFPALLARGDHVQAYVHRGYWIDIGTPEKYLQVHRDILRRRFPVALAAGPARAAGWTDGARSRRRGAEGALLRRAGLQGRGGRPRRAGRRAGGRRHAGAGRARSSDSVLWRGAASARAPGWRARCSAAASASGTHAAVLAPGAVLGEGTPVSRLLPDLVTD